MIHVSCGTLNSVSIEIYLNFLATLCSADQQNYCLHIRKSFLEKYASLSGSSLKNVQIQEVAKSDDKLCIESFFSALNSLRHNDILLTLPATKSDLTYKNQIFLGHTELLRSHWNNSSLPMCFISPKLILLLITDHIPLGEVVNLVNAKLIIDKVTLFLISYPRIKNIKRIRFWGVNPHAGEEGKLGDDEDKIKRAMTSLKKSFPQIEFLGPSPSDGNFAPFSNSTLSPEEILVSCYHDQGLIFLKSSMGFMAANCTFGGPYLRISPDHGTAANLLYKKKAQYNSLMWCHQLLNSWNN